MSQHLDPADRPPEPMWFVRNAWRIRNALALASIILAAVALGFAFRSSRHQATEQATEKSLRALRLANENTCINQNITHATDNRSHLADFDFDTIQIRSNEANYVFTKANLHTDYVALLNAGVDQSVLNRALQESETQLAALKVQIASQKRDANAKTWTALVDCKAAPKAGAALHVYAIAAYRPPVSATSVMNALRLVPVGSVDAKTPRKVP